MLKKDKNMEILLNLDVCEGLRSYETYVVSESDKERIKKKIELDSIKDIDIVDIGPGISVMAVIVLIAIGGLRLIKLGDEINSGLDGWIKLGKKVKKLFTRNKIVAVDIDVATAIAIEYISKHKKIVTLEKIQETVVNLADFTGLLPENKGLSQKPYNYYIQVYRINGDDIYVIGIRSDGEVKTIKHFSLNSYGITEADKNL